jgi:hypothetical protein
MYGIVTRGEERKAGMSKERERQRTVKRLGAKLHNRRVIGSLMGDGSTVWRFKILVNGEVHGHGIRMSREGVNAMFAIAARLGVLDEK